MSDVSLAPASPAWQARQLLRAARVATLATSADGQPFASLVTPALAPDGSVLMFLSTLAEHTRHLKAEPRCSIMVTGPASSANPQTAPRVSLTGVAEMEPDPALKARWLAVHPYAQLYADFTDFALYRIHPKAASLVGGFARAFRLRAADLTPDAAAMQAVLEAEPSIIAHCNTDHAEALALIAGKPGSWHMVACDTDGCDLAPTEAKVDHAVHRIAWSAPVSNAHDIRQELIRLIGEARAVRVD